MEPSLFQWLKDDIVEMKDEIKSIKKDVSDLLAFKWRIVGGTILASLILTTLFQIALVLMEHK